MILPETDEGQRRLEPARCDRSHTRVDPRPWSMNSVTLGQKQPFEDGQEMRVSSGGPVCVLPSL